MNQDKLLIVCSRNFPSQNWAFIFWFMDLTLGWKLRARQDLLFVASSQLVVLWEISEPSSAHVLRKLVVVCHQLILVFSTQMNQNRTSLLNDSKRGKWPTKTRLWLGLSGICWWWTNIFMCFCSLPHSQLLLHPGPRIESEQRGEARPQVIRHKTNGQLNEGENEHSENTWLLKVFH